MTAGGGWLNMNMGAPLGYMQEALRAKRPVQLLPVGYDDVVVVVSRCTGACCASVGFHTGSGSLSASDLRRAGRFDRDLANGRNRNGWRAADGTLSRSSFIDAGRLAQLFRPTEIVRVRTGEEVQHFACRELRKNGDCGIYERRPALCSKHGMRGPCDVAGCTMRVQVNPLVVRDPAVPPQEPREYEGFTKAFEVCVEP